MERLIVVAIDALDRLMVNKYINALPNFSRLISEGRRIPFRSVFPPDSDTAWASFYTGLNPARHGIVKFTDALSKELDYTTRDPDNGSLRGKTFWDAASRSGRRVCILHPHLGFPPWKVNGLFIGRSSVRDQVTIVPEDGLPVHFDLSRLNLPKGFPGAWHQGDYLDFHKDLVRAQRDLSLLLFPECEWDLFLVYSSSLDMIKHYYWSFCDPDDPDYPGDTLWRNAIRDVYIQHDAWIGDLAKIAGPETAFIVIGDHGHGRRPLKAVSINEFLRRNGLLAATGGTVSQVRRMASRLLSKTLRGIGRFHLENVAVGLLKAMPTLRNVTMAPQEIDWAKTIAYMSDLSGIKSYSYGGIRIRGGLDAALYRNVCERIVLELCKLRDPDDGGPVIEWVRPASELYEGPFIDRYPDIVYQLVDEYGATPSLLGDIFTKSPSRAIVPGSHRINSPELIVYGFPTKDLVAPASPMDACATVLDLLGVSALGPIDGSTLVQRGEELEER